MLIHYEVKNLKTNVYHSVNIITGPLTFIGLNMNNNVHTVSGLTPVIYRKTVLRLERDYNQRKTSDRDTFHKNLVFSNYWIVVGFAYKSAQDITILELPFENVFKKLFFRVINFNLCIKLY